jgi:hypothetical protein
MKSYLFLRTQNQADDDRNEEIFVSKHLKSYRCVEKRETYKDVGLRYRR